MAVYKVPQDVEAEDKLLGPFSFRQFIYLIVAALGIAVGFGLWQIFPGLIIIPLPFVALFLILALPLRKDQPMETYLVAVIRYFLKPRRRMWQPEGSIGLVTVTAAPSMDMNLTKEIGGSAAAQQLGYLAQVVDTQGWSTRGVHNPTISMDDTVYAEAQMAEDMLDEGANVSRTFDNMIDKSNQQRRKSVTERFKRAAQRPAEEQKAEAQVNLPVADAQTRSPQSLSEGSALSSQSVTLSSSQSTDDSPEDNISLPKLDYNPYPSDMHQHILSPTKQQAPNPIQPVATPLPRAAPINTHKEPEETSREAVSPDIMRLASNNDLSISALAHEAHRIQGRDSSEEVVISLR